MRIYSLTKLEAANNNLRRNDDEEPPPLAESDGEELPPPSEPDPEGEEDPTTQDLLDFALMRIRSLDGQTQSAEEASASFEAWSDELRELRREAARNRNSD